MLIILFGELLLYQNINIFVFLQKYFFLRALVLTLFKMGLFGAAHGWVDQKGFFSLKSVTHILQR